MLHIDISLSDLLTWIVVGAIAGFLASVLIRGHRMSLLWNIIIGLIGAFIGGLIFSAFHIQFPPALDLKLELRLSQIIIALVGAIIVLFIAMLIYRRRY